MMRVRIFNIVLLFCGVFLVVFAFELNLERVLVGFVGLWMVLTSGLLIGIENKKEELKVRK